MKKYFNSGVFISTIRRIKTLGIIAGILASVYSLGALIVELLYFSNEYAYYDELYKYEIDAITLAGILPGLCVIGAMIMTMVALKYLNSRQACDFYHALPQRRETTHITNVLAVTAMMTMVALTYAIVSGLTVLAASKYIEVNFSRFMLVVLNCIIAAFLTSAGTALAMSITGTGFSNLVMTFIIVFLPQLLVYFFAGSVSSSLTYEFIAGNSIISKIKYLNLAANWIISPQFIVSGWSTLYSVILGCGYTALGAYTYSKRRSEMAGVSTPSRKVQAIYRIAVGFGMFAAITAVMFLSFYYYYDPSYSYIYASNISGFVIAYIFAALMYFLFELLTTKKWKNLLRAIPGLFIIIALSAAMYGGMYLIHDNEVHFSPSSDEIEYVSLINCYNYYDNYSLSDYFINDVDEYHFDDPQLLAAVSDSLEKAIYYEFYLYNSDEQWDSSKESEYAYYHGDSTPRYTIGIKTANEYKVREIAIPSDYRDILSEYYDKKVEKIEAVTPSVVIDPIDCYFGYYNDLSVDQSNMLMDNAIKELSEMSLEELKKREKASSSNSEPIIYLDVYSDIDPYSEYYSYYYYDYSYGYYTLSIDAITLPDTYYKYIDMITCKSEAELSKFVDMDYSSYNSDLAVTLVRGDGKAISYNMFTSSQRDVIKELLQKGATTDTIKAGESFIIFEESSESYYEYYYEYHAVSLSGLSETEIDSILNNS